VDEMNAEIEAYMRRAQQALEVARANFEDRYWADALSKCYYAMFYAASALVRTRDFRATKHSAIIAAVGEHFAKPGLIDRQLHRLLIDMFDERQIADYEVMLSITEERARAGLSAAEQFVTAVQEYLGGL
jgi:uncharacterized protein (UPF0332 family)